MNDDLTFVFDEDGKAHALKEGKVVASADSVEELETLVREADSAAAFSTELKMPDAKKTQEAQTLGAEDEEDETKEASLKESAPQLGGDYMDPALDPAQQRLQKLPPSPSDTAADAVNPSLAKPLTPPAATPAAPAAPVDPALQQKMEELKNTPMMSMPKLQSTKEAKDCDCWDGYERVPGTKPCAEGSCRKCDDHRKKDSATHVVTPNGLKGQILGKVKDVWGDTVTVRFENGRIVQFPVSDSRLKFAREEAETPESPVEALRQRLAQEVEGDRRSLLSRIQELKQIKLQAADAIVKGASYEDEQELDTISIQADVEIGQVVAALDHIANQDEEYAAPQPQVVEQASMGSHDGTWLDDTFARMVNEANHTDYDQLMSEGPEAFVAELEAPALADAGVTREMASSFIRSKTAGANPEVRDAFESAWIDRVESLRRDELRTRKTRAKKEAAAENDHSNLPDDILFG